MKGHFKNPLTLPLSLRERAAAAAAAAGEGESLREMAADVIPRTQRGFLLITAVVLIVVVGLLAAVITFLAATGVLSGAQHANSAKALFVAESGLERGIYGYKNGTWCTSLSSLTPPSTVGEGDFSITGTFNIASVALGANITATDTVITVASTTGFASHGRIRIENEDIDYAAITATTFTGAQRGVAGSTAAAHNTGATVNVAQDECVIRSTGAVTAGNTKRVVEKGLQNPGAMIVYSKENPAADRDVPFFRRWDGTQWGPERQANNVGGDQRIRYMVLKFGRTRNEAILGTLQENGDIEVQVWNGNTQTWGAVRLLATVGGGNSNFRGFDIEYETLNDRAIVVFNNANSRNPAYQMWDGATWSVTEGLNVDLGGNYNTTSNNAPLWIELAASPLGSSNEIALITLDASGSPDVYGVRWNGDAVPPVWERMSAATGSWDTSAADSGQPDMNPSKVIDVAYEQLSGRAMFIWGDNAVTQNRYRIWDGATLSAANLLLNNPAGITTMGDVADWVRLVPRPNSNQLMYGVQDGARDLNTALWNGAAWTVHGEHDAGTEDTSHRNFDIVFETHPNNAGQAWLVWGSEPPGGGPNGLVRSRRWDGAAAVWVPAPPGAGTPVVGGGDTGLVQLATQPATGAILAGIYEDSSSASDDISEIHQVSGVQAWSGYIDIWTGPIVNDPVLERIFVAPERYVPLVDWREIFP